MHTYRKGPAPHSSISRRKNKYWDIVACQLSSDQWHGLSRLPDMAPVQHGVGVLHSSRSTKPPCNTARHRARRHSSALRPRQRHVSTAANHVARRHSSPNPGPRSSDRLPYPRKQVKGLKPPPIFPRRPEQVNGGQHAKILWKPFCFATEALRRDGAVSASNYA